MDTMAEVMLPESWLLLIYTVPAKPTSKRAFIWREIKKVGAIYLRDGVCALPSTEATLRAFHEIATKVEEFEGAATLAEDCRLPIERAAALIDQMVQAREHEYAELVRQTKLLAQHVRREREHRAVDPSEFEADLGKLRRWLDQILARDYFKTAQSGWAHDTLAQCTEELVGSG
jgi:hypothetical protein